MSSIAIIPARGGSKRLSRKNVVPFLGKPMLIWTCEAAQQSGCFDAVVVSTEDAEIAAVTREHGFTVLPRPNTLATDTAGTTEVCLNALEKMRRMGHCYDTLCCLYATAPLRTAGDIRAVMALLSPPNNADFAFALCHYDHSPYQALALGKDNFLAPIFSDLVQHKSQDLPQPLIGNGSTYAAKTQAFLAHKTFYGPRLSGYVMPRMRAVDIDTQEDFDIALCFANYLRERRI